MSITKKMFVILKSIIISYVIAVVLFMIYALLLAYTNIPERTIPTIIFVISLISIFIGSSFSLIKIREKGLINGGIVGFLYIFILYLLSSIFLTGFKLNSYSFYLIVFSILIGMIGGIVGVNLIKEEKKRK